MTKIYIDIYDMSRYNTCIQMHQRVCNFYTACMHMYIYIYMNQFNPAEKEYNTIKKKN